MENTEGNQQEQINHISEKLNKLTESIERLSNADTKISEEKLHYDSLKSLFISVVDRITIIISAIGLLVGFLTWSNGSDMRKDFKEAKVDMDNNIKEMNSSLEKDKVKMETDLNTQNQNFLQSQGALSQKMVASIESSNEQIRNSRDDAKASINGIKSIAAIEARNRIDEVLKTKNLDTTIEDVAQEYLKTHAQNIVSNSINNYQSERLEDAFRILDSNSAQKYLAIDYIINNKPKVFTLNQLYKLARNVDKISPQGYRLNIILNELKNNPAAIEWNRSIVKSDISNWAAWKYLLENDVSLNINTIKNILFKDRPLHYEWVDYNSVFFQIADNTDLSFQLLNSKDIIQTFKVHDSYKHYLATYEVIAKFLKKSSKYSIYNNTYFISNKLESY